MEQITVDIAAIYRDLKDHFGTLMASQDFHLCGAPWAYGCLASLDTLWSQGNYDEILELALDEGFDMTKYRM